MNGKFETLATRMNQQCWFVYFLAKAGKQVALRLVEWL
jgi:hypothetical protein